MYHYIGNKCYELECYPFTGYPLPVVSTQNPITGFTGKKIIETLGNNLDTGRIYGFFTCKKRKIIF